MLGHAISSKCQQLLFFEKHHRSRLFRGRKSQFCVPEYFVKEPETAFLFGYTNRSKNEKRGDEYRIVIFYVLFFL